MNHSVPQLLVKIKRQLQHKPAAMLLLTAVYVLSAGFSFTHVHYADYESLNSFNKKLFHFVHALEHADHSDHNDSDVHDCTACKFQSKSLVPDSFIAMAALKANYAGLQSGLQHPFNQTTTSRFIRAPPVA